MAKKFVVNPYEVQGEVDYDKLINEFGVKKLSKNDLDRINKLAGEVHPFLRRGIFFANRDLKWCLDEYEKGNKFFFIYWLWPFRTITHRSFSNMDIY